MRARVDVEVHRVTVVAPGGAGEVFGPIGHDDLDGVVIGMDISFHRCRPGLWAFCGATLRRCAHCQNLKPQLLSATASKTVGWPIQEPARIHKWSRRKFGAQRKSG